MDGRMDGQTGGWSDGRTDRTPHIIDALTHLEMYFRLPGPSKFTQKQILDIKACANGLLSRDELYDRYFLSKDVF